jgi:1-acyl-sn-glycerol-3-phosphate acyltransferase
VRDAWRLREPGGAVVVATHPTLLDYVVLGSLVPQLDCVVKPEIFRSRFMRGVATAAGYLANDAGDALVDTCAERVAAGRSLLLFPEGTRSPRGELGPFRRGAAHTALRSGRPLRPVVIHCHPASLTRGQKWYDVPERAMRFTLDVGEAIDPTPLGVGVPRAVAARRITAALRDHFEKALRGAPPA